MHGQVPTVTGILLTYPQFANLDEWWIPEGTVPQATYHDIAAVYLQELLKEFVNRTEREAYVARDLAIRYLEERPQIGIDPDVCVLDPAPPGVESLSSLCLWKEGHLRPPLCIEIVSESHPNKDYQSIHERYAWMHAAEVAIFDPMLVGPRSHGGPVALQLWRRNDSGLFERVAFGDEPAYCDYLSAWLIPSGRLLAIADDPEGRYRWPTAVERERAAKEQERAAKEQERAARLEAEADRDRERAVRESLERKVREYERH
jgi:Uma2 family endonuclease